TLGRRTISSLGPGVEKQQSKTVRLRATLVTPRRARRKESIFVSYLLFMDESGHDHRSAPYEVRGGIALHASKVWTFTRRMRGLESRCFGTLLKNHGAEL